MVVLTLLSWASDQLPLHASVGYQYLFFFFVNDLPVPIFISKFSSLASVRFSDDSRNIIIIIVMWSWQFHFLFLIIVLCLISSNCIICDAIYVGRSLRWLCRILFLMLAFFVLILLFMSKKSKPKKLLRISFYVQNSRDEVLKCICHESIKFDYCSRNFLYSIHNKVFRNVTTRPLLIVAILSIYLDLRWVIEKILYIVALHFWYRYLMQKCC